MATKSSKKQKQSHKKLTLPFKIVFIGCALALVVALVGIIFQIRAKQINDERAESAHIESQTKIDTAKKRLEEIAQAYTDLQTQYNNKKDECSTINFDTPNWYQAQMKCHDEEFELHGQLAALEDEEFTLRNDNYATLYPLVSKWTYLTWYIVAGSVAGLSVLAAFIVYLVKGQKSY